MYFSKHNIFSKIKDSENYFLVNPLLQKADILTKEEAQKIKNKDYSDSLLTENGYLIDEATETSLFNEKYLQFIDDRETDEIQIFFVPWYSCNFACSYCYQDEYNNPDNIISNDVIDAFFSYIDNNFRNRKKYITIFGGEPLLSGEKYKKAITYIIDAAKKRKLDLAFVTNGYSIEDYIDILKDAPIREIQVTLDGLATTHDKRRFLKNRQGSFEKIVSGIDLLIKNNIPVNLRMVVDKENITDLPMLANFSIEKGWTKSSLFKTQLGRNYELHHCQTNNQRLFSRIELYETVYALIQKHPEILEFHKPGFSISKFIFENGELPSPLFDSCPGTKTEWAFDFSGHIFSCTATVGKQNESLGTYYPEVKLHNELITDWETRDVLSIQEYAQCNVQLACGGGCASVAKNKTNRILSPDCRPVKELLELGIKTYFKE
ncbi:MAG: radical SAM protein [Bacteroidales bacterium]|nr:radical SAM protein [Bacteroidales bacterium]